MTSRPKPTIPDDASRAVGPGAADCDMRRHARGQHDALSHILAQVIHALRETRHTSQSTD